MKVVKYATDITPQVKMRFELQNLLKKVADNSTQMASAAEELTAVIGGKIKIKFERDSGGAESPAELKTRTDSTRRQAAEDSLRSDPFVQSLEQTFGARVIANSVRPVDGEAR